MKRLVLAFAMGTSLMVVMAAGTARAQDYRGPTRINFDERLIKGQTTKAGSVYIFDRQQSEMRSLVGRSRELRQRIIRTVFDE